MAQINQQYKSFSEQQKIAAWQKAWPVEGYSLADVRQDICGAIIKWVDHGNTDSLYGWEIDHIVPVSAGGSDHPDNLQVLQWQNNRSKRDSLTHSYCVVRSVI